MIEGLIFDVDGTLAETEESHRQAFNDAFAEAGLDWFWNVDLYRDLYRVTGGKERMRRYADQRGHASNEFSDQDIGRIHARKNARYVEMVQAGECRLRPGVERLIRASNAHNLRLAICSTTSRVNIDELVAATLGVEGLSLFEAIVSGEDVRERKPAPDAYLRVVGALGLHPRRCLAFEDSRNGLLSGLAAGLEVIVTPPASTPVTRRSTARPWSCPT